MTERLFLYAIAAVFACALVVSVAYFAVDAVRKEGAFMRDGPSIPEKLLLLILGQLSLPLFFAWWGFVAYCLLKLSRYLFSSDG